MFELEVIVVLVGLRTETNLFDNNLYSICFYLFFFLLELIQKLLKIYYLTYGRVCIGRYFDQIQSQFVGSKQCSFDRVNILLDVVAYQSDTSYSLYIVVYTVSVLLLFAVVDVCCYCEILLYIILDSTKK